MKTRSLLAFLFALIPALGILTFLIYGKLEAESSLIPKETRQEQQQHEQIKTRVEKNVERRFDPGEQAVSSGIKFPIPPANLHSPLGINTNEAYEQDGSLPFVDLFRLATPFYENIRCRASEQPCLTSKGVEFDPNGWPSKLHGGHAGVFFLRNIPLQGLYPGVYSVLYDGEGELEYQQNVEVVSRSPGLDEITFNARSDGFMTAALLITRSNPDNPLRNIRILMPGGICNNNPFQQVPEAKACDKPANYLSFRDHYADIIFNPAYLDFMKDFQVIRFMPIAGITRDPDTKWEQRPHLQEATWGGVYGNRGIPLETQIELANRLHANPWLNVPHGADDDYMQRFAQYVHDHLNPDLTPYVEYTNEAWNANFVHNEHMQKMGLQQKLDQNALRAGYFFYAKRSVEFFKIWETIYGGHDRFVRVIGGWDTRPDISGIILAYNDTYQHVDALAIAPYVGGNVRGFRESETVDDIFHLLLDEGSYRSLPKIIEDIKKHAELSKEFGVSLIAYEGGQGLVDWATKDYTQHPNPLFFAANRDPRMSDLYQQLYQQWKAVGGDLFVAFSAPRSCNWHGCWGLKEHILQPLDKAPKLQASLDFIRNTKAWWDFKKMQPKAEPQAVAHYLATTPSDKPRVVTRPAKDPQTHYRLEVPRALYMHLEGEEWDKRDLSGKWQVKWDKENLYLIVKVYDKDVMADSDDPGQDDAIEFFIDGDNSRHSEYDSKNDFHLIFAWDAEKVSLGKNNPEGSEALQDIPFEFEKKYDGYELRAEIAWDLIGITPKISNKIGFDVVVNDDDDGGDRDGRIAWVTDSDEVSSNPQKFGVVLISGR